MWLALLLAACGGPPPKTPTLPLDQTGASPVLELDRLPARVELSKSNLPAGASDSGHFTLPTTDPTPLPDHSGREAWVWDLPFTLKPGLERFAPPGMTVDLGTEPIPYDISPYAPGHHGWRLKNAKLHVVLAQDLGPQPGTIEDPTLAAQIRRLVPASSGLSPTKFVDYDWTRQGITRPGLLLPAPASASWDVTLPKGAKFRTAPDIVTLPLVGSASDGAEVTLVIEANGQRTEVADASIEAGGIRPTLSGLQSPIPTWNVDLSKWGGQHVTLRLESKVRGTPDYDWVFLGAPVVWGTPSGPVRHVVVIGIDTTRPDHLGFYGYKRDTSPDMDALAKQSAVFDHAWSPAPRTRPSFREATTGRNCLDAVGATNIGEVFRDHGFATAGIVANIHLNPRFGFDRGFDLWHLDTAAKAETEVDRSLAWLHDHEDRDTYLFVHFMDPHLFYNAPGAWRERYVTYTPPGFPALFNRWQVYDWMRQGRVTDPVKQWIEALYDGEIAYTSSQIGRLMHGIDAMSGTKLVVLHTDHGEEFWDHGGYEHNHTLYDELVRVALWIRPPGGIEGGKRIHEPVALWDIAPTLYDYLGFENTPPTDGRSLRPLIEGRDAGGWDRALPVGHLMYDVEQWGVVWRGHKYVIATMSGKEHLYDLVHDPGEHHDLAGHTNLEPYRHQLSVAHKMPVGPGWRIRIELQGSAPLTWSLPAPAVHAQVIDPEAGRKSRANQAWGEKPPVVPAEVAKVTLSDDGKTLRIEPGSRGRGTVQVRFDHRVMPGGDVRRGDKLLMLNSTPKNTAWVHVPDTKLLVTPGTVFEPPMSEAARMAAQRKDIAQASPSDLEELHALGYIGGGK